MQIFQNLEWGWWFLDLLIIHLNRKCELLYEIVWSKVSSNQPHMFQKFSLFFFDTVFFIVVPPISWTLLFLVSRNINSLKKIRRHMEARDADRLEKVKSRNIHLIKVCTGVTEKSAHPQTHWPWRVSYKAAWDALHHMTESER